MEFIKANKEGKTILNDEHIPSLTNGGDSEGWVLLDGVKSLYIANDITDRQTILDLISNTLDLVIRANGGSVVDPTLPNEATELKNQAQSLKENLK